MLLVVLIFVKQIRHDFVEEALFIKRYNKDTIEMAECDLKGFFDILYSKGWRLLDVKAVRD